MTPSPTISVIDDGSHHMGSLTAHRPLWASHGALMGGLLAALYLSFLSLQMALSGLTRRYRRLLEGSLASFLRMPCLDML